MAVNTRDRRMSMIGLGESYATMMKNPNGTIGVEARAMLLNLYGGFTLNPPSIFNAAWTKKSNQIFGPVAPPTPEDE